MGVNPRHRLVPDYEVGLWASPDERENHPYGAKSVARLRGVGFDLEFDSIVLAHLPSAALADAVPAVNRRDIEPGHRRVTMSYFTETGVARHDPVRRRACASRDFRAMKS